MPKLTQRNLDFIVAYAKVGIDFAQGVTVRDSQEWRDLNRDRMKLQQIVEQLEEHRNVRQEKGRQ